ncbi:MAG: T9SS type A sorting domain-containing protein, partial [Gemmatimonadetes bacterium]|nr:T9SS type A sorting domain-containing protein [Gemmatimonadota bacterium]
LLEDRDYVTGSIAAHVIEASGVGPFSRDDLQKKLVGQAVSISPYIDSHAEGFRGSVSPTDVETLFQLTYQYFNAPRVAPSAFDNVIRSIGANIEAGRGNPNTILGETFRAEVWQHHLRQSNFTPELLAQAELDRVLEIYRDRFADAGDFTFFFVGKIDIEQMRQLARTYLATLPATGRQETWRDRGVRPVTGVVEKVIPVGAENISNTVMVFTGTYERSPRRDLDLIGLGQLLDVRVVTAIRTELGESYSPSVAATGRSLPVPVYQIVARFTSAPENADRLAAIVREQAEFLRLAGPIPEELAVLRTQGSFFFSLQLQNNEFLADQLASRHVTNRDLLGMLDLPRLVQESTAASLRESAQIFLNPANQVRIVQVPADFGMSVVQEDRRHSTPQAFALDENYPNPFNSDTIIRFALPRAAEVELAVYNLAGQKVVTLVQGERQAGQYEVRWDGRDQAERPLASGVYLYKLHADGEVANRSLLLLR